MSSYNSVFLERMRAYKKVFTSKKLTPWQKVQSLFIPLNTAYKKVFNVEHDVYLTVVMADLRIFARGTGSKWVENQEKTLVMVGRNDVWERIISYSSITDQQIINYVQEIKND